jgi:L-aminopeptidase/D-esterase-like protein
MKIVYVVSRKTNTGVTVISVHTTNIKAQQKVAAVAAAAGVEQSMYRIDAVNLES